MHQPELTTAAAEGKGADLFVKARARHPGARLILTIDRRPGHAGERHMLAIEHGSLKAWDQCLPDEQVVDIYAPEASA